MARTWREDLARWWVGVGCFDPDVVAACPAAERAAVSAPALAVTLAAAQGALAAGSAVSAAVSRPAGLAAGVAGAFVVWSAQRLILANRASAAGVAMPRRTRLGVVTSTLVLNGALMAIGAMLALLALSGFASSAGGGMGPGLRLLQARPALDVAVALGGALLQLAPMWLRHGPSRRAWPTYARLERERVGAWLARRHAEERARIEALHAWWRGTRAEAEA
jgi:hypothetical protein